MERWRISSKVLDTAPIRTRPPAGGDPAEVHILLWERDHLEGMWAAKTFYSASGVDWPLYFHQGGRLSSRAIGRLRVHFPYAVLSLSATADRVVGEVLSRSGYTQLLAARERAFMLRKLIDPIVLGNAGHLLLMDTDVLFFATPTEILDAVEAKLGSALFNRDEASCYTITKKAARERLGVELPERVNAGLGLIPRAAISLSAAEHWLAAAPELLSETWLTEQTLQALYAGATGVGFLPETYRLSRGPGIKTSDGRPAIAKHYVSYPRPYFYQEGLRHVLRQKLLHRCSR